MKKVACAVLILTMVIFLVNPLSSEARGGHWGGSGGHSGSDARGGDWGGGGHSGHSGSYARGGHWGGDARGGGWWPWWPWAVIGGAAVLSPFYYSPYYEPPPVVIQEQPSAHVQPAPSVTTSLAERIFVYPRQGQSEELLAKDRYECHNWAMSQTWREPRKVSMEEWTVIIKSLPEAQRADYRRAESACLDGRGYTVK